MTAFALITGVIFRSPVQKTSKAGKPYTTCTVKAGSDDNAGGDFWNVLSFSESGQLELLRLEVGDAVSVRGKMKVETYVANDGTTKISRSIFADAALGLRPAPRERKPKAPAGSQAADALVKQSIIPPSGERDADETGIIAAGIDANGHGKTVSKARNAAVTRVTPGKVTGKDGSTDKPAPSFYDDEIPF
jgi:single-stranded DNA-binding protein